MKAKKRDVSPVFEELLRILRQMRAAEPDLVEHIISRDRKGFEEYGKPMEPFDRRDTLLDLQEELVDAMAYLVKARMEVKVNQVPLGFHLRSLVGLWSLASFTRICLENPNFKNSPGVKP